MWAEGGSGVCNPAMVFIAAAALLWTISAHSAATTAAHER